MQYGPIIWQNATVRKVDSIGGFGLLKAFVIYVNHVGPKT